VNVVTLKTLAKSRGLSQSDLARQVGISRQAVSSWFRASEHEVDVRSTHLRKLAQALDVPAEMLLEDLPGLSLGERRDLEAQLLWDMLYPDVDSFLVALAERDARALARLVETFGLYRSAKLVGSVAWTGFPEYKRFIHPARRRGLENLWQWRSFRTRR
jgi:transcriptional regulator with XRE-family HTH domain